MVLTIGQRQLKIELVNYIIGQKKLSREERNNKRETAILREYLTCLIGVPEGEERDNRKE